MLSTSAKRLTKETIQRLGALYNNRDLSQSIIERHRESIKRQGWTAINEILSDYRNKDFNVSRRDLKKSLMVVARVVYGNEFWHDIDFCRSCGTGIWTMCECNVCTSTTFPGWVNYRTGTRIEPTESMIRDTLQPFFRGDDEIDEMIDIVDQMGTRILQGTLLRWVARHYKSIGFSLKARTQLEARSRLTNREIGHSELSDGQLLMAINIAKSLNVGLLR